MLYELYLHIKIFCFVLPLQDHLYENLELGVDLDSRIALVGAGKNHTSPRRKAADLWPTSNSLLTFLTLPYSLNLNFKCLTSSF